MRLTLISLFWRKQFSILPSMSIKAVHLQYFHPTLPIVRVQNNLTGCMHEWLENVLKVIQPCFSADCQYFERNIWNNHSSILRSSSDFVSITYQNKLKIKQKDFNVRYWSGKMLLIWNEQLPRTVWDVLVSFCRQYWRRSAKGLHRWVYPVRRARVQKRKVKERYFGQLLSDKLQEQSSSEIIITKVSTSLNALKELLRGACQLYGFYLYILRDLMYFFILSTILCWCIATWMIAFVNVLLTFKILFRRYLLPHCILLRHWSWCWTRVHIFDLTRPL